VTVECHWLAPTEPDCHGAVTRVAVLRTVVVTLSPFLRELVTRVLSPEST
jgi:hypothetical protein